MDFQLVRASDDEIIIWHTEHGHIYGYYIAPRASDLTAGWCRNIDGATQDAESLKSEALAFATQEARSRHLLA